jgi:hypothetical protein
MKGPDRTTKAFEATTLSSGATSLASVSARWHSRPDFLCTGDSYVQSRVAPAARPRHAARLAFSSPTIGGFMKAILLSLGACAALAGCVGYGGASYGYGGYGYDAYGASYPGYGYGGGGVGVYAPVYRDRDGGGRGMRDRDHDGIPNRADRDRDGDGVRNRDDSRPNNPRRN